MQLVIVLRKEVADREAAQSLVDLLADYVKQLPGVRLTAHVNDAVAPTESASAASAVSPTADDPPDFD